MLFKLDKKKIQLKLIEKGMKMGDYVEEVGATYPTFHNMCTKGIDKAYFIHVYRCAEVIGCDIRDIIIAADGIEETKEKRERKGNKIKKVEKKEELKLEIKEDENITAEIKGSSSDLQEKPSILPDMEEKGPENIERTPENDSNGENDDELTENNTYSKVKIVLPKSPEEREKVINSWR